MYGVSNSDIILPIPSNVNLLIGIGFRSELFPLGPRLLPHGPLVPIAGEQMSVERCLDGCAAAGYNAAALEAGQVINSLVSHQISSFEHEMINEYLFYVGMLYVFSRCVSPQPPVFTYCSTSDCDLVDLDGGLQPEGWESTNNFECADPCLANATEVCGGLIPHSVDPSATTEGRLSAYLICDLLDRC